MSVYVFSGGQDSTVALAMGLHRGDRSAVALSIDYGQRNRSELTAGLSIVGILSRRFRVPVQHVTLEMPELAHALWPYAPLVSRERNVRPSTANVPGRNALFLSIAFSYAISHGLDETVFGTTAVDAHASPDGKPKFLRAFVAAYNAGVHARHRVRVRFPLLRLSKGEVLVKASRLGILDEVKHVCVSCHNDGPTSHPWGRGCGRCGACSWRRVGWEEFTGKRPRTVR